MNPTFPSVGLFLGRPERCARLARGLRDRGFEVTHYNTEGFGDEPHVRVARGLPPALLHLTLRTNHDVYFTGLSHVPSTCLYLNRMLRGKPYVFNATGAKWEMFHDRSKQRLFAGLFENRLHPFLLERTFAGASRIVCNSRFLERKIAERFPRYRDRLVTVYNGIDFERYSSGRRFSIPGVQADDFVLLCVTALNYRNKSSGLRLVIEAFERLRAVASKLKLVVAAKTSDPAYEAFARECVERRNLQESVILTFNSRRVPDLLASSDLFVYATPANSNDSLPRALLEAQAAGLPAVATATSGCPEIVADGETGRIVPYDAAAIAEGIRALMHDPGTRRAMRKKAQTRVLRVFNWEQMADGYAAVFRAVVAGPAAPKLRERGFAAASPRGS